MNKIHLELGIQEPLSDKPGVAVPMTHSHIAKETRKTQADMMTLFEEQSYKLYAELGIAWTNLLILKKRFARSKDKAFHEDLERIQEDLLNTKAAVGDFLQKPDNYVYTDGRGNKFIDERIGSKPFERYIQTEKVAYRVLAAYDSFSGKHSDKFIDIEYEVEDQLEFLRKIEALGIISRLAALRAQKKSKEILDKATVVYYIVEQLNIKENRVARMWLKVLKGKISDRELEELETVKMDTVYINDLVTVLERQLLELGK